MCAFLCVIFYFRESAHKKLRIFCAHILQNTKKYTKTSQNGAFFTSKITCHSLIYRLMNLTQIFKQKNRASFAKFLYFFCVS